MKAIFNKANIYIFERVDGYVVMEYYAEQLEPLAKFKTLAAAKLFVNEL